MKIILKHDDELHIPIKESGPFVTYAVVPAGEIIAGVQAKLNESELSGAIANTGPLPPKTRKRTEGVFNGQKINFAMRVIEGSGSVRIGRLGQIQTFSVQNAIDSICVQLQSAINEKKTFRISILSKLAGLILRLETENRVDANKIKYLYHQAMEASSHE